MLGTLVWSFVGGLFDKVGSSMAGLKSKNICDGYGANVQPVLQLRCDKELLQSKLSKDVPVVTWTGPWREIDHDQVTKSKSWISPTQLVLKAFDLTRYLINGRDKAVKYRKLIVRDGTFRSPAAEYLPEGAKDVVLRVVLPLKEGMMIDNDVPGLGVNFDGTMVVHFAATGDEGFSIRQAWYANPLAAMDGIGSVIHIQSYYGKRRSMSQKSLTPQTSYPTVEQTVAMGYATIVEGVSIVRWLLRNPAEGGLGFKDRVCTTGVSLGGAMAAGVACESQERIATAPCLPSHGATIMAKGGALSRTVDWQALQSAGRAPLPSGFDDLMDPNVSRNPQTQQEAQDLLAEILETATSIEGSPKPVLPEAMVIVGAKGDEYCPPESLQKIVKHVDSKCEVRWVPGGHVTGFLLMHRQFRQAVVDALQILSEEGMANNITAGRDTQANLAQLKSGCDLKARKACDHPSEVAPSSVLAA